MVYLNYGLIKGNITQQKEKESGQIGEQQRCSYVFVDYNNR